MKIKKTKSSNVIYKIISALLALSSCIFLGFLFYLDLLPAKYMSILLISIVAFNLINICLINIRRLKKKIKKTLSTIMILAIIVIGLGNFYLGKTIGILSGNGEGKYKTENYMVIVLKDSKYKKLKDITGEKVGYFKNSVGAKESTKNLSNKIKVEFDSYNSSSDLVNDLLESKINVIILEESIKNVLSEEIVDFENSIRVIYTFKVRIKTESTLKEVNVTKEPFAVYLSGIDTYGEISSVSRSDVNIVMLVNPKTHQILLISIPRDYYVQLHGTTGNKDKLTHAGIYGVDMSIKTIEDLLEMEINYFVKVNFTSVIDIVDVLGGLDVYSEYTFISYSNFSFKKGMNYVNGEQALDFARTRKAFVDGDRQRGKNQQAVIEALIRKASQKSIITKYSSLLSAIDGKYQTNMSTKKITALIKMQLNDMPKWNITSYSLTGHDSKGYTYTYNQLLYVMEPDQDSVSGAIELINKVLSDEMLENSYESIGGASSKVTRTYVESSKQNEAVEKKNNEEETKDNDNNELEDSEIDEDETMDISEEDENGENKTDQDDDKDKDKEILEPLLP